MNISNLDIEKVINPRKMNIGLNYILIGQTIDFLVKGTNISPKDLFDYSDRFQFPNIGYYCKSELKYKHFPYHFYTELFENNFINITANSFKNRSEFLDELIKDERLSPIYKESIYITIQGDYRTDFLEKRFYEEFAYFVSGIASSTKTPLNNIKFLSDVTKNNNKGRLPNIELMSEFDKYRFESFLSKFGVK